MRCKEIAIGLSAILIFLASRVLNTKPSRQSIYPNTVSKQEMSGFSQTPVKSAMWDTLGLVEFRFVKDSLTIEAIFPESIQKLEGKEIALSGYMYPLSQERQQLHFMLSALPISACFFCGIGGPQTVVEVYAKHPVTMQDGAIHIQGTLRLQHEQDSMLYQLMNASLVDQGL